MDLGSECSTLESVEDNEVTPERTPHASVISLQSNGSCADDIHNLRSAHYVGVNSMAANMEGKDIENSHPMNSPPITTTSPGISEGSPLSMTKGYGLKKWRRIRRDFIKDVSTSVDSSKILKRDYPTLANPATPPPMSVGINPTTEASGPTNMGSSSESRLAIGSAFAAGTDSENSEDQQNSKSSTAASAPKVRYFMTAAVGYAKDNNKIKNLSGKSMGNSVQRSQQGKSWIDTSKKPRGERVKIEKENSHSSMESDSRSNNFFFMQGATSATNNRKPTGRSMNYDGENSDEARASAQQSSEEHQAGYHEDNVGRVEDLSPDDIAAGLSWDAKADVSEERRPASDRDPLVDSLYTLQSVQEALEKEVKKLGELGKEPSLQHDTFPGNVTSTSPEVHGPSFSDQLGSKENGQEASHFLEIQIRSLMQKVNSSECKLEEAKAMLKRKESRVVELEATLHGSKSQKELESTVGLHLEKCREMEIELEALFQQKIEAEIEYLAMARTIQRLRVASEDPITLVEEHKTLVGEQAHMLTKLGEAESKAVILKNQAKELEAYCGEILGTEEVLKIQKRVCRATTCFFIQLILLVVVFGLFILQLSPRSTAVVPT